MRSEEPAVSTSHASLQSSQDHLFHILILVVNLVLDTRTLMTEVPKIFPLEEDPLLDGGP